MMQNKRLNMIFDYIAINIFVIFLGNVCVVENFDHFITSFGHFVN